MQSENNRDERPFGYVGNPLDWVDLFGLTSCQLAKTMENSGISRPGHSAAHHIVPETAKAADPARKILKKHGIDINSELNGVFLPNRTNTNNLPGILHNGRHPNEYIRAVNERIGDADKLGGKPAVLNELNNIKTILTNAPRNSDWRIVL